MNEPIEMQNTVVIIITTGITNVVIIGFHYFNYVMQRTTQNFTAEKTQVFPPKKGNLLEFELIQSCLNIPIAALLILLLFNVRTYAK